MSIKICHNFILISFRFAAEAEKEYGAGNVKIYRSTFGNMYFSVLERKQQTLMKLVCAGPEEKVGQGASCIHIKGTGPEITTLHNGIIIHWSQFEAILGPANNMANKKVRKRK